MDGCGDERHAEWPHADRPPPEPDASERRGDGMETAGGTVTGLVT